MSGCNDPNGWSRRQMAQRAANDIPDGSIVNLGIGIPELIASVIPEGREVLYHSENGLLGMGPAPTPEQRDHDLVNAGKKMVTAVEGASFFHHADSFSMIRGGHIDICVLGAMQVSECGDLANWSTGDPDALPAVGGAMDLVGGAKQIYVLTQHCSKKGKSKILQRCSYPLTGKGVVNRIYTDLAVFNVEPDGLHVEEIAPGVSMGLLQERTGCSLIYNERRGITI